MKNIEEFYNDIMASEELKDKLAEASANRRLDEFFKENGVLCDKEQFKEYAIAREAESSELSENQLEDIAGGSIIVDRDPDCKPIKTDCYGREIQWRQTERPFKTFHCKCSKCGKWLYKGSDGYLYCDPCNEWYFWWVQSHRVFED